MPWGFHHQQAVKEENKSRLCNYIVDTRQSMSRINGDITYYKQCRQMDNAAHRNSLHFPWACLVQKIRRSRTQLELSDHTCSRTSATSEATFFMVILCCVSCRASRSQLKASKY
ncbi:unnamed protein product [Amoebophrya sp. A25]|nr:unnamed protein product [Amoebophrya sp. A25]|eukprot:GSA25T00011508001.1